MDNTRNQPSAAKFWTWFNPLGGQAGRWAFVLNRVTAIGLTIYLFLHLYILRLLAQGDGGYDQFLVLAETPIIKIGELLVVAAAILHGLNGIRIILTTFGIGVTRQVQLFYVFTAIGLFTFLFFVARIFMG
jgi:succinate dehydrogenase / fumarate reductase cytochrome b subunit